MFTQVLWKCFLVICICCLICPKRVRANDIYTTSFHPIKGATKLSRQGIKNLLRQPISENLNTQPESDEINFDASDPGFNLTEDEMIKFKIWPQGVIPYYIDDLSFDKIFREQLRSILETVEGTGLQFVELPIPPTDQSRWVFFINRRGVLECQDYTTYDFINSGVQKVVVGYDCLVQERALAGTVLALAGVPPQHNAPDRDKYIQVIIENVLPGKQYLFKSLSNNEWLFHDLKYDYNSAGHFDTHKYSANGKATIKPKQNYQKKEVEIRAFTSTDLKKIKLLYNYISKIYKAGSAKIAECNHLFVPRASIVNYVPDSEEQIKPMSRPNKYLGNLEDAKSPDADYPDKSDTENLKGEVIGNDSQYNANENSGFNIDKNMTNTSKLKIKLSLKKFHKKKTTYQEFTQDPILYSPYFNTDERFTNVEENSNIRYKNMNNNVHNRNITEKLSIKKLNNKKLRKPEKLKFKSFHGNTRRIPKNLSFKNLNNEKLRKPEKLKLMSIAGKKLGKSDKLSFKSLAGEKLCNLSFKNLNNEKLRKPEKLKFISIAGKKLGKSEKTSFKNLNNVKFFKPHELSIKKLYDVKLNKPNKLSFKN